MKTTLGRLAILPASTVLASLAGAQTAPTSPFYGKIELQSPTSSQTRRDLGDVGFGVGFGYELPLPGLLGSAGRPAAELSYLFNSSDGNRFQAFDLKLVGRFSLGGAPYVGLGVGASFSEVHADGSGGGNGGSGGSGGSVGTIRPRAIDFDSTNRTFRKTQPMLQLLAGANLGARSFVELGYRMAPTIHGVRQDVLSLAVGVRF